MMLNEITALTQIGFPVLSVLIFLPLATMALLLTVRSDSAAHGLVLTSTIVELALSVLVWMEFQNGVSDMQFVERLGFYHLGVDGISVLFLPITAMLMLLVTLYTEPSIKGRAKNYLMAMLAFEATMMGAFSSLNLMMFWIFFVLELLPSYLLILNFGTGEKRKEAASNYLAFMAVASALLLAGFVMLAGAAGDTTFDYTQLWARDIADDKQNLIFFLIVLGLAIKAPLFPFHTWMPKVLEQGPVVGMSVYLVGVKLGTYAMLRFVIPLLPEATYEWFWLVATAGAVSMVYGALIALIQTNLRRMLAFASLSHMGVVIIGLFSLNLTGYEGGLLQMINLGITGAGLYFVAGFLYTRMGPPDTSGMGGIGQFAPIMAMTFLIIGLAGVGMPGTNGFNGEHLVMIGAYKMHWGMSLMVGIGTFLSAAYFLWYYQRAFLGGAGNPGVRTMRDLDTRELLIAASIAGVIFWIGLFTSPFLNTMNGSLRAIDDKVHNAIQVDKLRVKHTPTLEQDAPAAGH